jgi:hypothetical protein
MDIAVGFALIKWQTFVICLGLSSIERFAYCVSYAN